MKKLSTGVLLVAISIMPVVFLSCSSSGGSSDPANFAGVYAITALFIDGNYSGIGWADIWAISQSGSSLTVATGLNGTLTGTVDGDSCTINGSWTDIGSSITCDLSLSGNVVTGTSRIETPLTWAEYDMRGVR